MSLPSQRCSFVLFPPRGHSHSRLAPLGVSRRAPVTTRLTADPRQVDCVQRSVEAVGANEPNGDYCRLRVARFGSAISGRWRVGGKEEKGRLA